VATWRTEFDSVNQLANVKTWRLDDSLRDVMQSCVLIDFVTQVYVDVPEPSVIAWTAGQPAAAEQHVRV
jgi:hypothetical protein